VLSWVASGKLKKLRIDRTYALAEAAAAIAISKAARPPETGAACPVAPWWGML